jgi:transposase
MTLQPFWRPNSNEISKNLFLPKKEELVEFNLPHEKNNRCINNRETYIFNKKIKKYRLQKIKDSWLNVRVQRAKDLETLPNNKDYLYNKLKDIRVEDVNIPKCKATKVRLFPNKEQFVKLRRWFGCYRRVYNDSLGQINKEREERQKNNIKDTEKDGKLKNRLRQLFGRNSAYKDKPWMILPSDTRYFAIDELIQNRRTNLNKGGIFTLHFKEKDRGSISIPIREDQFKQKGGKYKFLKEIRRTKRKIYPKIIDKRINKTNIPEFDQQLELQRDRFGHYYLIFKVNVKRDEDKVPERIISIDPGVRTFLTGYTNDGYIYHLGENNVARLSSLNTRRNRVQSLLNKRKKENQGVIKAKQRCHLRQKYKKIGSKIFHLVEDAHKKMSTWLLRNFEYIILPKLDTNKLCRSKKLSKKQKNNIKSWRHCSFIDRLKFKLSEFPNRKLIIPTEEYTSKTCTNCGVITNPKRSKLFKCSNINCNVHIDRDSNGARNILLKLLTEHELRAS